MVVSSDRHSKVGDTIPHKVFQVPFKQGYLEEKLIRPALEENKRMVGWSAHLLHLTMCECLLNSTQLTERFWSHCVWHLCTVRCVSKRTSEPSKCGNCYCSTKLCLLDLSHGPHASIVYSSSWDRFSWQHDIHTASYERGAVLPSARAIRNSVCSFTWWTQN